MNCICKWFLAQTHFLAWKCFLHRYTKGFCHEKKHVNCFPTYIQRVFICTCDFHCEFVSSVSACMQCKIAAISQQKCVVLCVSWALGKFGYWVLQRHICLPVPSEMLQCLQLWWLVFPGVLPAGRWLGQSFNPNQTLVFYLYHYYGLAWGFHSMSSPGSLWVVTLSVSNINLYKILQICWAVWM